MVKSFQKNGFILLADHFDVEKQIVPIRDGIRGVIQIVAEKYGVEAPCDTNEEAMTIESRQLAEANREYAGEVYDAANRYQNLCNWWPTL